VRDVGHNLYLRLVVKEGHESWIKRIATDNDDTMLQWMHEYRDLARCLRSEHTEVWVTRASWNRMRYLRQGKLHIHAVLRPEALDGWASVQMMGAHFEDSVLKLVWEGQGVRFAQSKRIVADRETHDASLTKRIRLYSFGDKRWSKKLFAKLGEHEYVDERAVAALHPTIEKVVGTEPFLYAVNNDIDGRAIEHRFPSARRVPNNPHGLNHFQDYTKAVFLTCLNNRSPHFAFLKEMYGVAPEQLARARYHEYAYQFFMRSAARTKGSTEICHFVIPDADAADHFAKNVFPGCIWTALEVPKEIEKVLGSSACGRNKTRRKAGHPKAEQVKPQSVLDRESRAKRRDMESMKMGIGIYLFLSSSDVRLTQEAHVGSWDLMPNSIATWDDFRTQMRHLADQFCPKKEEATLVSGASFAPLLGETTVKGVKNVVDVNGIWFDVDDGEMHAEDWRIIFPELKFLAFNSFNNGKDGKLKYRVVFPTVEPASASQYHHVWDRMTARVRQAGFYVGRRADYDRVASTYGSRLRFSGIDMSKRTANSFFYLPSRAGMGKKHSFWLENWGEDTSILDPLAFLGYSAPERPEYETEPA
jgi:hypothetical protein